MATKQRPEHRGAADKFYSSLEAAKYDTSARMAQTQRHLADRALQLLELPEDTPALLLDCGCGTGYSGRPLERAGHTWIGTDVSEHMLRAGRAARPQSSNVIASDLGQGLGFRKGVFDGAISISAVQWLCHATRPDHVPEKRVRKFFVGLHAVLASGARAVLQFYPEQPEHVDMLRAAALQAGFAGGLIVDYPWSERSKKLFLVLLKAKHSSTTSGTTAVAPKGKQKAGIGKGRGKGSSGKVNDKGGDNCGGKGGGSYGGNGGGSGGGKSDGKGDGQGRRKPVKRKSGALVEDFGKPAKRIKNRGRTSAT